MPNNQFIQGLVHLAKADGVLSTDEVSLIKKMGHMKDLSNTEINTLFYKEIEVDTMDTQKIREGYRFDFLYAIVQVMKIDGRIYREELHLCLQAAHKLGYDENAVYHLITKARQNDDKKDKERLRKLIESLP